LLIKKKISEAELNTGKKLLHETVAMLIGLIKSNSDRIYENKVEYNSINENS